MLYPIIQVPFLSRHNMVTDSKVEILLTPGIKEWSKRITKGGRVTVSRNLANHSRRSLEGIITHMGQKWIKEYSK